MASADSWRWCGPPWPMGPVGTLDWGGAPASKPCFGVHVTSPPQFGSRCHRRAPGPLPSARGRLRLPLRGATDTGRPEPVRQQQCGTLSSPFVPQLLGLSRAPALSRTHTLFRTHICLKLSNSRSQSPVFPTKKQSWYAPFQSTDPTIASPTLKPSHGKGPVPQHLWKAPSWPPSPPLHRIPGP